MNWTESALNFAVTREFRPTEVFMGPQAHLR